VSAAWHPDEVLEPRFRWSFPERHPIDPELLTAALDRGLAERMTGLLARRGVTGAAELAAWFAEPIDGLHDPRLRARPHHWRPDVDVQRHRRHPIDHARARPPGLGT
jgi:hypothetical protein